MTQGDTGPPTVFVSYAHDDQAHQDAVLTFARLLAANGVRVELDLWHTDHRHDWYAWVLHQIQHSDHVIVVASPMYRRVGDGTAPGDLHRGVQAEAAALREHLYDDRPTWLGRILPVVLPGGTATDLPGFLQPFTTSHYSIESFTKAGAEALIRVITRQPLHVQPETDPVPPLPPSTPELTWRPLTEPVTVRWRADLLDSRGAEPPRSTLELHLVPTTVPHRITVGRLEAIRHELAELGRRFFPPGATPQTGSSSQEAGAYLAGRDDWYGLAVDRDGRRSAWGPLPRGAIGSVFDRADVATRLTTMLAVLLDIDLTDPAAVVLVAGLDPTGMLRKGPVHDQAGTSVTIPFGLPRRVRLKPEEHVDFGALRAAGEEAAAELTARLAMALGFPDTDRNQ